MIAKILIHLGIWGGIHWAEKQTKERLSVRRAKEDRRADEDRLYKLATRKQKGRLAKTDIDDTFLRYAQVRFKSRWLDQKINNFRGVDCDGDPLGRRGTDGD